MNHDHPKVPPSGKTLSLAVAGPADNGQIDPVCGMTVDPASALCLRRPRGPNLVLLLSGLRAKVPG